MTLLALSIFFYGAYNNTFHQAPGTAAWRAALLVIGLVSWYSLTYHIMSAHSQKRLHWLKNSLYILAVITIGMLLLTHSFINEEDNALFVAHMQVSWTYIVYGLYQWSIAICILLNLLIDDRVGLTRRGKYFLVASVFPILSVVYGVFALASPQGLPRVIPDLFIFFGVFILGLSVARHQTLTERRTTFQDFPITTLTVFGLTAIYAYLAWDWGLPIERMSALVGFVILTHAVYDLAREFLERLRIRNEGTFRKQLHQLEGSGENELSLRLQEGLDLLCQTLNAPSGLVAIRREEIFIVTATRSSVPIGSEIAASLLGCEDVSHPKENQIPDLAWIAPSFEGQTQVAVVGIGRPRSKLDYASGDLDLLAEVADQIGTLVSLSERHPRSKKQIQELAAESQASMNKINSVAGA
jgi:hypothetical protein